MKTRTRYLFIGLGAVFFLVAAPLTVFYVGGIRYDFKGKNYAQTGILSVVSDPKKANITMDGKAAGTTPANFRFLAPKEYAVSLAKDGYWDWSKRLDVKAGLATIASGGLDKIYLLKKGTTPQTIADGVTGYYYGNSGLVYLTADSVKSARADDNAVSHSLNFPDSGAQIDRLVPSPGGSYFLLTGPKNTYLLNANSWAPLVDISRSVAAGKLTALAVADTGEVLGLRGDTLVKVTAAQNQTLVNHASSFAVLGTNLYYIQSSGKQNQLAVIPLNQAGRPGAEPQVLIENIPGSLAQSRLLVTEQKDVLLLAGNSLYKINAQPDLVSDAVRQVYFDQAAPSLLYTTDSELYWYDFLASKSHLITRSTQAVADPQISFAIGYAFYFQNGGLQAMELDDTDHQNNYHLLDAAQGSSLRLDKDAKNIYFLDGGKLETLNVR